MKKVTVQVEDYLYDFYRKVGQQAGGIAVEKVMADALFKLAGELSLHALGKQKRCDKKREPPSGGSPAILRYYLLTGVTLPSSPSCAGTMVLRVLRAMLSRRRRLGKSLSSV